LGTRPTKKGELLFRLDPEPYQYQVDLAAARLAEAEQAVLMTMTPPQGRPNPRDLRKYLANYEEKTGDEVPLVGNTVDVAHANWTNTMSDEIAACPLSTRDSAERVTPRWRAALTVLPTFEQTLQSLYLSQGRFLGGTFPFSNESGLFLGYAGLFLGFTFPIFCLAFLLFGLAFTLYGLTLPLDLTA
jgi:hypothetical protein